MDRTRFGPLLFDSKTVLDPRNVGHTCRHTMAARAVSANVSTQLLKHWGGWKSTQALEHYAHLDTQGLRHMQRALESFQ